MAVLDQLNAGERAQLEARPEALNLVKVFSATKFKERDALGERVTDWLRAHPAVKVLRTVVSLTSDHAFHCLSIVIVGHEKIAAVGSRRSRLPLDVPLVDDQQRNRGPGRGGNPNGGE
jgi:hypothetical protein